MAKLRKPTMSLPAVLSAWSRRTAIAILAIVLMVFSFVAPAEAVTPTSGPTSGGTSVTIEGIHFVQVVGGRNHSLGVTSDGTVFSWGSNSFGQLGDGSTTSSNKPVQVKGVGGSGFLTGVTSVAAGEGHSLAVSPAGVFAWGAGYFLGVGSFNDSSVPVQVKGVGGSGFLTGVTSVAAGTHHSLAVSPAGVFAWGMNYSGQLGNGSLASSNLPVQVKGVGGSGFLTGVTGISGGADFTIAVTPVGVFGWGSNSFGQLGDGSLASSNLPVQVKGVGGSGFLTGVTSVAAGSMHSLATSPAGVFAWGDNSSGELGDGSTSGSYTPVQVKGVGGSGFLTGVTSVAAGEVHSLATSPTGVFAWGRNVEQELGNGSSPQSSVPVEVLGVGGSGFLTGVTSVAAGAYFSLANSPTGIVAWGYNFSGQLGIGLSVPDSAPALSANFQPLNVAFAGNDASGLTMSGSQWTVLSPSGIAGSAPITATARVFGGTTAATPASISWDAGTFAYVAPTPSPTASSTPSSSSTQTTTPAPTPNSAALGSTSLAVTGVSDVGTFLLLAILSILGGLVAFIGRKRTRYSVWDKNQS